jgi:polysaccharide export outer membrane protein
MISRNMKTMNRLRSLLRVAASDQRGAIGALAGMLALILAVMSGCQSVPPDFSGVSGFDPGATAGPPASVESHLLQEGDVVKVAFEGDTNLNTVVKIQANGAISLPLTGEMKVAGKTLAETQAEVAERYKTLLKVNEATVTLIQTSAGVYISGAVLRPGRVNMERPLTVMEAIMEAGGFNPTRAKTSAVTVLRMEGGQQKHYRLDLKKALKKGDPNPFYLKPQDIVHVPEKTFNF